jgi:hypothetical protein
LVRCRYFHRGWLCGLLAFLGFVNGLIPWGTRNFQSFHDVFPIVDSTYLHLWIGNNSRATGGPQTEAVMEEALADAREQDQRDALRKLDQPKRYQALAHDVLQEVRDHPGATLKRRLRAGLNFFFGESWFKDNQLFRTDQAALERVPSWLADSITSIMVGSLLAVLSLGMIGWRWSFGWRFEMMPASLAPIWFLLPYALTHAEAFHGPRLPLDGVFLSYAALTLACCWPSLTGYLLNRAETEGRSF